MSIWDLSNPSKPTAIKDPDSVLDYPIDFSAWLTGMNDAYLSHQIIINPVVGSGTAITCPSSSESNGVIIPFIAGGTVGDTNSFTVRITTVGGRTDDRTFWLKIKEL